MNLEENNRLFAGVDVGGTNIKVGLVDDAGNLVADTKFPTEPARGPQISLERARTAIEKLADEAARPFSDIVAVGLGTPGPMDIPNGMILTPTNLPQWHNMPVKHMLADIVGLPVAYANDAAAAAFGEYWVGSGKQSNSLVLITLGTGVGGGIIVNDFSIDGAHSHGAEIGHMTVDSSNSARVCGCGMPGHLEAYASATAVVARSQEQLAAGAQSSLLDQISESSPLTALMISEAAAYGDPFARGIVMETADWLGVGISTLAHIIDPNTVLLGGAMNFGGLQSPLGFEFIERIRTKVLNCTFPMVGENLTIDFATLGSEAGYVGAAGLARREYWHSTHKMSRKDGHSPVAKT